METQEEAKPTLGSLGPQLPIGSLDPVSGQLNKLIEHRRWTLKVEKELGSAFEGGKRDARSHFVSMVLASVCSRIGALSFEAGVLNSKKSVGMAVAQIGQLWYADALYAFLWVRRQCLGNVVTLDLTCPRCELEQKMSADLDTIEVRAVNTLEEAQWKYEVRDGFKIRGVDVKELVIGPARWGPIESAAERAGNLGAIKSVLIQTSIVEVPGLGRVALTEDEFDEMSKYDLEELYQAIDDKHCGPDLSVDAVCPSKACGHKWKAPIDWSYGSFFGASGPSKKTR